MRLNFWKNSLSTTKGVVQISHGMAEHSGRYERFAKTLNSVGYHCYAHDHPGHGDCSAEDRTVGLFANQGGLNQAIEEIATVNRQIATQHPSLPIVLLGHSMGAILALHYACHKQAQGISALALLNAGVDGGPLISVYRGILKTEGLFRGRESPSKIAPAMTFRTWNRKLGSTRTQYDWLSRDENEVDKFIADPFCGIPITISLWFDVTTAIQYCAKDESLARLPSELPVYLLGGAADPCTDNGRAVQRLHARMQRAGMSDVTGTILDDTRHETLNEINRDQATGRFIEWLDERFA